ncbi:MAG: CBS domain-containing protein [Azonexus sp.]|nr:CBS domain-containing protein [Azonexus sp.]MDZ4315919.1 CBS domain-containing protein [Azonexus sp.]
MPIGDFCKRDVVVSDRNASVTEAARLMRKNHVGALIVIGESNGASRPLGIVTDRDIVIEVIACGLDPDTILIEDIMLEALHTVSEREGVFTTIRLMREYGVRRLPVVNDMGELEGIITLDDLIALLASETEEISRLLAREKIKENRLRP